MKIKYFIFGFITCLIIVAIAIWMIFSFLKNERMEFLEQRKKEKVTEFKYEIFDASELELDSLKVIDLNSEKSTLSSNNDIVFINFWATWCIPCISEFESIENLKNKNPNIDFIFFSSEDVGKIKKFKQKNTYSFNFLKFEIDENNKNIFNHDAVPTTYIIDKKNKLGYKISGAFNYNSELFNKFIHSL